MEKLNIAQLLRQDHDRLRHLFEQIEITEPGVGTRRDDLVWDLLSEIEVYTSLRRQVVYPALRPVVEPRLEFAIGQQLIAFRQLEDSAAALGQVATDHPRFDDLLQSLKAEINDRLRDDERDILPFAEGLTSGQFEDLPERIASHRSRVLAATRKAA